MTGWLAPEVVQRAAGVLIHSLWEIAAVAIVSAIGLRLLARRSAEARYVFGISALVAMLAGPALTYAFYEEAGALVLRLLALTGEVLKTEGPVDRAIWTERIVLVWGIGFLFFTGRVVFGWQFSRRLLRGAGGLVPEFATAIFENVMKQLRIATPVRLLVHARIDTPMVAGYLRPFVLLPAAALTGLSPDQLSAVLAHELAHIRRQDYIVNVLQRLAEAVLFYHPAVWWLSAHIRAERENCCDDLAVSISGDRRAYVRALMSLERNRIGSPSVAVAASGASLRARAERLLGVTVPQTGWEPTVAALLFVAAWFGMGLWQTASGVRTVRLSIPATIPSAMLTAPEPFHMAGIPGTEPLLLQGTFHTLVGLLTPQVPQSPSSQSPGPPPNGEIYGRVIMSNGKPANGVQIFARAADAADWGNAFGPAITGIDGRYALRKVPPGRYIVYAGIPKGQPGMPVYHPGTFESADAATIIVDDADARGADIRLIWPVASRVSGHVNRDPRIDDKQTTLRLAGGPQSFEVDAGADGAFEFHDVPTGEYTLSVEWPFEARFAKKKVVVEARETDGIDITVPFTTTLISRTVVERGPTPRYVLSIQDAATPNGPRIQPPYTDGEYRVAVTGLPDTYEVISLRSGTTDLLREPLRIDGKTPDEIVVTLRVSTPSYKVRGHVAGFAALVAATPEAGRAIVSMSGSGLLGGLQSRVQPDGSFEFGDVYPGAYSASVLLISAGPGGDPPPNNSDCFRQFPDCIAMPVRELANPAQVVVADKDVSDVEVPGLRVVSGRIAVNSDERAPNFRLRLTALDSRGNRRLRIAVVSPPVTPEGKFQLLLPKGEYNVQYFELGQGLRDTGRTATLVSMTSRGRDLLKMPLNVSLENDADIQIVLDEIHAVPVTVRGRVVPAPDPATPATLFLDLQSTGSLAMSTTVAADGTFEFNRVWPGRYNARVLPSGVRASFDIPEHDVEGLEIVARPRMEITGRVTMEGGQSLPSGIVIASPIFEEQSQ